MTLLFTGNVSKLRVREAQPRKRGEKPSEILGILDLETGKSSKPFPMASLPVSLAYPLEQPNLLTLGVNSNGMTFSRQIAFVCN